MAVIAQQRFHPRDNTTDDPTPARTARPGRPRLQFDHEKICSLAERKKPSGPGTSPSVSPSR